jgi:hypothetical protein
MGHEAAVTDQRHMGVVVVAVGRHAEVPDHAAAEVLPDIDAVAPRDAADPKAAALDPQLMDALVSLRTLPCASQSMEASRKFAHPQLG